jgi:hypothetical protein
MSIPLVHLPELTLKSHPKSILIKVDLPVLYGPRIATGRNENLSFSDNPEAEISLFTSSNMSFKI